MQRKTGVVIKIFKNYVCIKTVKGELYNIKLKDYTPNIGDIYSGTIINKNSKFFNRVMALILILVLSIVIKNTYAYFTPKATIIINIPPTVQMKVNKWNTVVKVSSTRQLGRNLISDLHLKKLPLETALIKIVDAAKKKNIITKNYTSNTNNNITIYTSLDNTSMNLSYFENYLKDRKLNYKINYNGTDKLD